MKFLSSGGLGDAFIVMLKVTEWSDKNYTDDFDWLHVESNDISKPLEEIWSFIPFSTGDQEVNFKHDSNYIQNLRRHMEGRTVIPTAVQGPCNFYKEEWPLNEPFLDIDPQEKEYDIVLQASGGYNADRTWNIDPLRMAQALAAMGRHVTIVGTDKEFSSRTTDPDKIVNLVGRTKLFDVFEIIEKANVFIGLSGLLNYFACAAKIPNIHVIESEDHERVYYHPKWAAFTQGIQMGTLPNVLRALKLAEKAKL